MTSENVVFFAYGFSWIYLNNIMDKSDSVNNIIIMNHFGKEASTASVVERVMISCK